MQEDLFDHEEPCDEPLETAAPNSLVSTLNHIMGPVSTAEPMSVIYDVTNCRNIDPGAVLLFCYAFEVAKRRGRRALIRGQPELISELEEHFSNYWGSDQKGQSCGT